MVDDERHDVWEEPDSPRVREFRLSVQSLLRGSERERDIMELAGEALDGLPERMSKAWAVDVVREIFSNFGLEFQRAQFDEVATPRWSMMEPSIIEEGDEEDEEEEEEEEEELEETETEIKPMGEMFLQEDPEEEQYHDAQLHPSDEPAEPEHQDDSDVDDSREWETPPHTPPETDDEGCCIPSLKRLSRQTQPHTLTPPVSPPSTFSKPAPVTDSEKEQGSITPVPSLGPVSPKRSSFIQSIRKRLSKTSIKFRITRRIRSLTPEPPVPAAPMKEKRARRSSKASTEDIQTVLEGPVLKLNRMSDMSLPLTAAERKEMDRRRAHESKMTEDFDLVLRLGTLRNPPASPTSQDMEAYFPMGDGSSLPAELQEIPPVPMIEPEYFTSPTSPRSQATEIRHTISSGSRTSRPRSVRRTRTPPRRKSVQNTGPVPVRPFIPMRNVLSENNLRLLNASMSSSVRPQLSPAPISPPPVTGFRRRKLIPSDDSSINSRNIPVPPIATAARRRSSQRSAHGRRFYPSMDYFPLAQTTALGLKGGRIGLVQMGSPRKANKILGDVVLIVPEREYSIKRRRRSRRDVGPGIAKRGSVGPTMSTSGSRAKVERLRGEKLPIGTFGDEREFTKANVERLVSRPSMERNYTNIDGYIDGRPGVDQRPSIEQRPSMEYRPSMDGRRSVEGRVNVESRATMDRRVNVESRASIEHRTTVESRASIDRRMNVESRASIDRLRNVESRASIDRPRNLESRADLERKAAVESRASMDRRTTLESRASVDRMRNIEPKTDLERQPTVGSRTSIDRKTNVESRQSFDHRMHVESRASMDAHINVESRASLERKSTVESQTSLERKRTLELHRPKSNGAVWII